MFRFRWDKFCDPQSQSGQIIIRNCVEVIARIVIFHNFLTAGEIETIKDMATPRFKRATVQNYLTGELETANYR